MVLCWGPNAEWTARLAGNQARRLLSEGIRAPVALMHTSFGGGEDTEEAEVTQVTNVQECVTQVGLRVSTMEMATGAGLVGHAHMPWRAAGVVEVRFIQPLVDGVARADPSQQLSILRSRAPFSGVVEFVNSLPEVALQHGSVAYWARTFLVNQCNDKVVPPELHGLRVGGGAAAIGGKPVTAMSSDGVDMEAFRTTAGPQLRECVNAQLGAQPAGVTALYLGTTLRWLSSVMAAPRHDVGRRDVDFGPGLYTTTKGCQALAWAKTKETVGDPAVVVVWYVPDGLLVARTRYDYAFGDDFKDAVCKWRTLSGVELVEWEGTWPGHGFDVVAGPVARLGSGVSWHDAGYEDIFPLNCKPFREAPDYGDQCVLCTRAASTEMLLHESVKVCGVVILAYGVVLEAPAAAAGEAGGAVGAVGAGRGGRGGGGRGGGGGGGRAGGGDGGGRGSGVAVY